MKRLKEWKMLMLLLLIVVLIVNALIIMYQLLHQKLINHLVKLNQVQIGIVVKLV